MRLTMPWPCCHGRTRPPLQNIEKMDREIDGDIDGGIDEEMDGEIEKRTRRGQSLGTYDLLPCEPY